MPILWFKPRQIAVSITLQYVALCILFAKIRKERQVCKGQFYLKNNLWSANFSQKNEQMILCCLLFYSSQQTNQIYPFVFWENLQLANLLFGFI